MIPSTEREGPSSELNYSKEIDKPQRKRIVSERRYRYQTLWKGIDKRKHSQVITPFYPSHYLVFILLMYQSKFARVPALWKTPLPIYGFVVKLLKFTNCLSSDTCT